MTLQELESLRARKRKRVVPYNMLPVRHRAADLAWNRALKLLRRAVNTMFGLHGAIVAGVIVHPNRIPIPIYPQHPDVYLALEDKFGNNPLGPQISTVCELVERIERSARGTVPAGVDGEPASPFQSTSNVAAAPTTLTLPMQPQHPLSSASPGHSSTVAPSIAPPFSRQPASATTETTRPVVNPTSVAATTLTPPITSAAAPLATSAALVAADATNAVESRCPSLTSTGDNVEPAWSFIASKELRSLYVETFSGAWSSKRTLLGSGLATW